MELVAGYPYWLIKSGLLFEYPKLLGNTLGFGGNGITFSLVAAEIITDLSVTRKEK